jgi:hypothetical protein
MKLIELLKQVEAEPTIPKREWLSNPARDGENPEDDAIIDAIQALACKELIAPDGRCNWDAIERVKNAGFHVGPGEQDSFGWLTGVIRTAKGRINYG